MNWKDAKKHAGREFPKLQPSRAAGFCVAGKPCLLVPAYDASFVLVVHTEIDLRRLRSMCDAALAVLDAEKTRKV